MEYFGIFAHFESMPQKYVIPWQHTNKHCGDAAYQRHGFHGGIHCPRRESHFLGNDPDLEN